MSLIPLQHIWIEVDAHASKQGLKIIFYKNKCEISNKNIYLSPIVLA
jgi:hypothetical protein